MNKSIFIDRDGILNELIYYADWGEWESPRSAEDLIISPDVLPALQKLQQNGWMLFLVSNQPSYAKGKVSLESLYEVHNALQEQFELHGIVFQEFYYSYTHPNGVVPEYTGESEYRKPNPGFLLDAKSKYGLDMSEAWMVGDRDTDIDCGQKAGCKTVLITYKHSNNKQGKSKPNIVCPNFSAFVQYLLSK
jgi:D-glycero-D-manno-heptose 1,7-bisphosphate phosphatase